MKKIRLVVTKLPKRAKTLHPEDPEDQVTVTRDRTGKTISVTGSFCGGGIRPVKLIGTYREWKSLEARAEGTVTYSVIQKLLHRSKRTPPSVKIILRKYAVDVREEFSDDVYRFSCAANVKNPAVVYRPRGRTTDLNHFDLTEVRVASRVLYEAVGYWFKEGKPTWSEDTKRFIRKFRDATERKRGGIIEQVGITRWGIEQYYGLLDIGDGETFERKYIYAKNPQAMLSYMKTRKFKTDTPFYRTLDGTRLTLSKLLK